MTSHPPSPAKPLDLDSIARYAANRIVDEKHGAWGGVLLQVDSLLIPIIREACIAYAAGCEEFSRAQAEVIAALKRDVDTYRALELTGREERETYKTLAGKLADALETTGYSYRALLSEARSLLGKEE